MKILFREQIEQREREILAEDASCSSESEGRDFSSKPDVLRTDYQRDRDRIIHSKSFRRLSHKTQVFLAAEGDHFRTRLTHTLEVSQIARTISRALNLNEDLTEAIALAHDLGHTPFGHTGEEALNICLTKHCPLESREISLRSPYQHNEQSLRVVEVIENNGQGLNLTAEVRDGILCHTGPQVAETLEGRVVATADRIAYVNHDIDDAIRANLLTEDQLPKKTKEILGTNHSSRIEALVLDMVTTSAKTGEIGMSRPVWDAMMELRAFLFEAVYSASTVVSEVRKALHLVETLFDYFVNNMNEVPQEYRDISGDNDLRAVTDYIASMTDRYAKSLYQELFIPQSIHR